MAGSYLSEQLFNEPADSDERTAAGWTAGEAQAPPEEPERPAPTGDGRAAEEHASTPR